jgi:hypothetical protein
MTATIRLQLGFLTAGHFEPGMTVGGRIVRKWHTTDTTARYSFGKAHTSVCIEFTTGETGDAIMVSP